MYHSLFLEVRLHCLSFLFLYTVIVPSYHYRNLQFTPSIANDPLHIIITLSGDTNIIVGFIWRQECMRSIYLILSFHACCCVDANSCVILSIALYYLLQENDQPWLFIIKSTVLANGHRHFPIMREKNLQAFFRGMHALSLSYCIKLLLLRCSSIMICRLFPCLLLYSFYTKLQTSMQYVRARQQFVLYITHSNLITSCY